jgi:putative spermidine/putrescine transport system permease protein
MLVPIFIVVAVSFNGAAEVIFPPKDLSLRWYVNAFSRQRFLQSFSFSLLLAIAATLLSLVIGLLCSLALVRFRFKGREAIATLLNSPLMVPQVVLGMGLLIFFVQAGIASSVLALGLLHIILTLPYTVRVLSASLVRFPQSLEEAAIVHGANRLAAFVLVTLPCVKPGIVAAGIFAFVTSFDNFTATQFLIWDKTTLPIEIFAYAVTETDPTVCAISTMLIVATVAVVVFAEWSVGLETVTG